MPPVTTSAAKILAEKAKPKRWPYHSQRRLTTTARVPKGHYLNTLATVDDPEVRVVPDPT